MPGFASNDTSYKSRKNADWTNLIVNIGLKINEKENGSSWSGTDTTYKEKWTLGKSTFAGDGSDNTKEAACDMILEAKEHFGADG